MTDKQAPVPDRYSAFYWENAARGRLAVQACEECGQVQFPPNAVCESCQSQSLTARPVSGRATLYAMTVIRQAFHPAWKDSLPYVIAQVQLDDAPGIRIQTNIVQADPADLKAGDPLEVVYEQRGDVTVPQFRPTQKNGT
ncbi:Zn-ribbon domain-containing OB-fold protein [Streptomyces prunicolor]|uniref:Zn-ribbon domain-containing OB-fold protein n=1 Tax=Streptomyces prunicolor TaxID=67348 RepID=UPI0005BE06C1|nr:OB-fold domain-containing protein [Streptomyces prunicolor]